MYYLIQILVSLQYTEYFKLKVAKKESKQKELTINIVLVE